MNSIHVIDSHTAGEPTRVIVAGGPDLGDGTMAERRDRFRDQHDEVRSAVINEPRGADHLVGALLCTPHDPSCAAGVIFFNNAGYLHMCGHGTMGLVVTLANLGCIGNGTHRIETPVGIVTAELHDANRVSLSNLPAYRYRKAVSVPVEGLGTVTGDIAWGGNWFFLIEEHGLSLTLQNVRELTEFARRVKTSLDQGNIRGGDGAQIDHIQKRRQALKPSDLPRR